MAECSKCNKLFSYKYNLKKHLEKKIPCTDRYINKTCVKCNKIFATVQTYKHHIDGRCKKRIIQEPENDIVSTNPAIDKLQKEIEELKNIILDSNLTKGTKNKNSHNVNNINNISNSNNQTVNITINPVNKPNYFFDKEAIKKILNKGFKSVPELIKRLYFDKNHPENHNVFISNKKDWRISYFDGTEWVLCPNNDVLDQLYDDNSDYLVDKFNELVDELDASTLYKFGNYKEAKDENINIEDNKHDIRFILYNKKDLVIYSKKNG